MGYRPIAPRSFRLKSDMNSLPSRHSLKTRITLATLGVFLASLWTLSLFSGEVWSYSGWGVPMVWEDASTLTAIATWLFYVGAIHLHLGGLGSRRTRAGMSVLGVALVLVLNGGPDMGPFRNPLAAGWLP